MLSLLLQKKKEKLRLWRAAAGHYRSALHSKAFRRRKKNRSCPYSLVALSVVLPPDRPEASIRRPLTMRAAGTERKQLRRREEMRQLALSLSLFASLFSYGSSLSSLFLSLFLCLFIKPN